MLVSVEFQSVMPGASVRSDQTRSAGAWMSVPTEHSIRNVDLDA